MFTYGAPQLKFGAGASDEIGFDLTTYGVRRVLVITDPGVAATGHPQRIVEQIAALGIEAVLFDRRPRRAHRRELDEAVEFARDAGPWDAFVAVGGGSAIDTAKAVNLLRTNPGELLDYVNPRSAGPRPGARRSSRWSPSRRRPAPAARARRCACSTSSRRR